MARQKTSSTPKPSRLASIIGNGGGGEAVQLTLSGMVNDNQLAALIDAVLDDSGAVMIGRTSDGGALAFTFYLDGDRIKRYITSQREWDDLFAAITS